MFLDDPPESPGAAAAQDSARQSEGYVANFVRLWCWRPELFRAFVDMRLELMKGTTLSEREVAVVVTATVSAFGDSYCSLAWGERLAGAADAETAAGIIAGELPSELSGREVALAEWCRAVVRDPMSTTDDQVAALRRAGFDDGEVFEATLLLAMRLAFSTVNASLGAEPDRQLADRVPAPVAEAVSFGRRPAATPSMT